MAGNRSRAGTAVCAGYIRAILGLSICPCQGPGPLLVNIVSAWYSKKGKSAPSESSSLVKWLTWQLCHVCDWVFPQCARVRSGTQVLREVRKSIEQRASCVVVSHQSRRRPGLVLPGSFCLEWQDGGVRSTSMRKIQCQKGHTYLQHEVSTSYVEKCATYINTFKGTTRVSRLRRTGEAITSAIMVTR